MQAEDCETTCFGYSTSLEGNKGQEGVSVVIRGISDEAYEALARAMRATVYGVDEGWHRCREHWLEPGEFLWLQEQMKKEKGPVVVGDGRMERW